MARRIILKGDGAGILAMSEGRRLLYNLKDAMKFNNLKQLQWIREQPDGSSILVSSIFGMDTVSVNMNSGLIVDGQDISGGGTGGGGTGGGGGIGGGGIVRMDTVVLVTGTNAVPITNNFKPIGLGMVSYSKHQQELLPVVNPLQFTSGSVLSNVTVITGGEEILGPTAYSPRTLTTKGFFYTNPDRTIINTITYSGGVTHIVTNIRTGDIAPRIANAEKRAAAWLTGVPVFDPLVEPFSSITTHNYDGFVGSETFDGYTMTTSEIYPAVDVSSSGVFIYSNNVGYSYDGMTHHTRRSYIRISTGSPEAVATVIEDIPSEVSVSGNLKIGDFSMGYSSGPSFVERMYYVGLSNYIYVWKIDSGNNSTIIGIQTNEGFKVVEYPGSYYDYDIFYANCVIAT